jgi:hypothetical protein
MWVLKYGGKTTYAHHVSFWNVNFQTKETPDNPHTKGSLKFKNVDVDFRENDGIMTVEVSGSV